MPACWSGGGGGGGDGDRRVSLLFIREEEEERRKGEERGGDTFLKPRDRKKPQPGHYFFSLKILPIRQKIFIYKKVRFLGNGGFALKGKQPHTARLVVQRRRKRGERDRQTGLLEGK